MTVELQLPPELKLQLEKRAADSGVSVSDLVLEILRTSLLEHEALSTNLPAREIRTANQKILNMVPKDPADEDSDQPTAPGVGGE